MKIVEQVSNVKCDIGNCKNKAEFSVVPDGVSARQYLNLCKNCMDMLYAEMSRVAQPRAIVNIVARGEKLASQSISEKIVDSKKCVFEDIEKITFCDQNNMLVENKKTNKKNEVKDLKVNDKNKGNVLSVNDKNKGNVLSVNDKNKGNVLSVNDKNKSNVLSVNAKNKKLKNAKSGKGKAKAQNLKGKTALQNKNV